MKPINSLSKHKSTGRIQNKIYQLPSRIITEEPLQTTHSNIKPKEKSLFTIASEEYMKSFFNQKSKGLLDIIKDDKILENDYKLKENKLSKNQFESFIKRNNELIEKRTNSNSKLVNEKNMNEPPKLKKLNLNKLNEFYETQIRYKTERDSNVKQMQEISLDKKLRECSFKPKIDENSKNIIINKEIEEEKHKIRYVNDERKEKDVYNRLFKYQQNSQLKKNLNKTDNDNVVMSRLNSKNKPLLVKNYETFKKINFKQSNGKKVNKTSFFDNDKFSISNKINDDNRTTSNERNKLTRTNKSASSFKTNNKSNSSMQASTNTNILIIQKIVNDYENNFTSKEDLFAILTRSNIINILTKLGFIKNEGSTYDQSVYDESYKLLENKNSYFLLSFIMIIMGYYYSDIINNSISLINIKNLYSKVKTKFIDFKQLILMEERLKVKYNLFIHNRNQYLNTMTKEKNQVKIISIQKELDREITYKPVLSSNNDQGRNFRIREMKKYLKNDNYEQFTIGDYASIQAKKRNIEIVNNSKRKIREELKECTFKPIINKPLVKDYSVHSKIYILLFKLIIFSQLLTKKNQDASLLKDQDI